jgi:hypothetical protein
MIPFNITPMASSLRGNMIWDAGEKHSQPQLEEESDCGEVGDMREREVVTRKWKDDLQLW